MRFRVGPSMGGSDFVIRDVTMNGEMSGRPMTAATEATGSGPGDKVVARRVTISYARLADEETIETRVSPEDAIQRLKRIRQRRYESIAAIDRQIETLEGLR